MDLYKLIQPWQIVLWQRLEAVNVLSKSVSHCFSAKILAEATTPKQNIPGYIPQKAPSQILYMHERFVPSQYLSMG